MQPSPPGSITRWICLQAEQWDCWPIVWFGEARESPAWLLTARCAKAPLNPSEAAYNDPRPKRGRRCQDSRGRHSGEFLLRRWDPNEPNARKPGEPRDAPGGGAMENQAREPISGSPEPQATIPAVCRGRVLALGRPRNAASSTTEAGAHRACGKAVVPANWLKESHAKFRSSSRRPLHCGKDPRLWANQKQFSNQRCLCSG